MQLSLEGLIELFNVWHAGTRHHILVRFTAATGSATTDGTDTLTVSGGHGLVVGNRVRFTGSPPSPLDTTTTYFVVATPSATQFKASTTRGGSALTVSAGSATYEEQPLNGCDPLAVWVKHELTTTGYERVEFTFGTGTYDANRRSVTCTPVEITRSGVTLAYTHAATIRGGTSTVGDLTGALEYWHDFGGLQTVAADQTALFTVTPRLTLVPPDLTGLNPC